MPQRLTICLVVAFGSFLLTPSPSLGCTVTIATVERGADHLVVNGRLTGCPAVSLRWVSLPLSSRTVRRSDAEGSWSITYSVADGLTARVLEEFACGAKIPRLTASSCGEGALCFVRSEAGGVICKQVPCAFTTSVNGVSDPTQCVPPGTYTVRLNENLPPNFTVQWQVDGRTVLSSGTTTEVVVRDDTHSVVAIVSGPGCLTAPAVQLQGCGAVRDDNPNVSDGSPDDSAANPPVDQPAVSIPVCPNPIACQWCWIWMVVNLVLIILAAIRIFFALCPVTNPTPVTVVLAVLAFLSMVAWLIVCGLTLPASLFCALLNQFIFWLGVLISSSLLLGLLLLLLQWCSLGAFADALYIAGLLGICVIVQRWAGCVAT